MTVLNREQFQLLNGSFQGRKNTMLSFRTRPAAATVCYSAPERLSSGEQTFWRNLFQPCRRVKCEEVSRKFRLTFTSNPHPSVIDILRADRAETGAFKRQIYINT